MKRLVRTSILLAASGCFALNSSPRIRPIPRRRARHPRRQRRLPQIAAVLRPRRFRRRQARLHRHAAGWRDRRPRRQAGVRHKTLCVPAEGRGAGDGQSEPVAAGAAQCGERVVQGHRARLPGARARHRQHDHHRRRHRIDPDRSAAVQRDREGRARSLSRQPPGKAGRGRDLQPQPCRPFRRRQGRDVRRGRRIGQGKSDRAGWIHGACGGGEHHRRQRHAPPRAIPVRQHASRRRARAGRYRSGQGAGERHHLADPAQRRDQAGLRDPHCRRRRDRIPSGAGLRGAGRDDHVFSAVQIVEHGGRRHPQHAQPLHHPRRGDPRRPAVVALHRGCARALWRQDRRGDRAASLADVGQ